jgi:peptidoglycan/xylan/chitin deacetylase (PgdA/CDA1 family)
MTHAVPVDECREVLRAPNVQPPADQVPVSKRIKGVLGRAAGAAGVLKWDFSRKMVIVAFHRVNDSFPEDPLTYSSRRFEQFCRYFKENFNVLSLSEQVAGCNSGKDMGGTLSITLDDGYRDNFEVAAPILRKLGLPATFFVTTSFINSPTVAFWDLKMSKAPGWMDWDQVRALDAQGFEIGCHTDTHIDMGTAPEETIRAELEVSKRKLQEQLGHPTPLFAYPFGGPNNITPRSLQMVREAGFSCCVRCFGGVNDQINSRPFELNRIAVGQGFVTPEQFGLDLFLRRV